MSIIHILTLYLLNSINIFYLTILLKFIMYDFNKYNNEYYIRNMLDYLNIYINMINNTN